MSRSHGDGRGGPRDKQRSALYQLVGRRVHWNGEPSGGEIVGVTQHRNGWGRLVVKWDDGAPDWWATVITPKAKGLIVESEPWVGEE